MYPYTHAITRAHGWFSLFVVVGSIGTGLVLWGGFPLVAPFASVLGVCVAIGAMALRWPVGVTPSPSVTGVATQRMFSWPLVLIGLVGALALAVENAHQSWGAVFLTDVLDAPPVLAAAAPATFAAITAATRFAAGAASGVRASHLLVAGGSTAAGGTVVVAMAPSVAVALVGLVLAAAGTAVLLPALLSSAIADVEESLRGRATSTVASTAYVGFLLGPVFVGLVSEATSLRWALAGVALLALAFAIRAPTATSTRRPA